MAERPLQFHVSAAARRDIAAIIKRSFMEFGEAAALRYRTLIRQALLDIEADHARAGSQERPEILVKGARTYDVFAQSIENTRTKSQRAPPFSSLSPQVRWSGRSGSCPS